MIIVAAVAVVVVLLVLRRRRRQSTLSGLNSDRPVFHIDPPSRRLMPGRKDTL